jgi:predicted nucleic acid-binding protein
MTASFVDTTVLVDLLRKHPPARLWMMGLSELPHITPVVWMELISGAQNREAQRDTLLVLSGLTVDDLTSEDQHWAMRQLARLRLSHNVSLTDCLIASISQRVGVPLYSNNLTHFAPLLGSLVQKPY